MKKIQFIFFIFLVFYIPGSISAQEIITPPLVNYQGTLSDSDDNPLSGNKKMEFAIYDAPTGGNLIWGPQVFNAVPLIDGKFNVILGTTDTSGRSISEAFRQKDRYLGITVENQSEISPRQQILSAPFAVQAEYAAKADHATEADHARNADEAAHAAEADMADEVRGMPPADYDSGWFHVQAGRNYDFFHDLGTLPRFAMVWGATSEDGENMYLMDSIVGSNNQGYGAWLQKITTTDCRISTGASCAMSGYGVDSRRTWAPDCTGYIRFFLWK
jgi:hypothetical protein